MDFKECTQQFPKLKMIYIRCITIGDKLQFYFSENGIGFKSVDNEFKLTGSGHGGAHIGLFSYNLAGKGYVDFDWFRYNYDN